MSVTSGLYSLVEACRLLSEHRHLVTFLVKDREIPTRQVGRALALDDEGLDRLRAELAAWHAKHGATSRMRGSRRASA